MKILLPLVVVTLAACSGEPPLTPPPALATSNANAPGAAPPPLAPKFRLPATATPTRAAVALTLVPADDAIAGVIDIDLNVNEETSVLWLNGTEIKVDSAELESGGAKLAAHTVPGGDDFIGFAFDKAIAKGPAKLHIAYQGRVSPKDDRGVFRETEDGRPYLFSQFENIEARRAFPCFDEPSFKIPWSVTLKVKASDVAISNTPIASEKVGDDGWKTLHFKETKPLPSYLVAFAVGPFELVDGGKTKKGTPVRVATPAGRHAEAAYAVQTTTKIIDLLEDYFGVPYPYDKMDVVPIPRLVSFGAMENAGMITIGMRLGLARHAEETVDFEHTYVDVMAHELAHQWFGDLVTMAWWDDVWLNEAFATWMGNKIVQRYHPEWRFDISRLRDASGAMGEDALLTARKIHQEVLSNDDIQNAFDGITYEKGATVIGMFEGYLGAEAFQRGIKNYLLKHATKNATQADFLADVSEGAGKDVKAAFSTFLDQPGVPLVTAKTTCEKGVAKVSLSQERSLPFGSKGDALGSTWQIPVCVRYGTGKESARACTILGTKTGELALPGKSCPDWVMPKDLALGYYRVAYDAKSLDELLNKHEKSLSVLEKISVIEDSSALTGAGRLPLGDALARVPDIAKDKDPKILGSAIGMSIVSHEFMPPSLLPNYARFVDKTFAARAKAYGFRPKKGDSQEERLLRPTLLSTVVNIGEDAALIAEAKTLAAKWLDDPSALEVESVDLVLDAAAEHGDRALFDRMVAELKKSKDDNRRAMLLTAMSSFRDPKVYRDALSLVLSDDLDIRETLTLLRGGTYYTTDALWAFVKEHFDDLSKRLPNEARVSLVVIGARFCDETRRADYEAFFKERAPHITGGPRRFAQTLEGISLCSAIREKQAPSLAEFLKKE